MVNRWFTPDEQFADSTGTALSGAKLFFYASGTSTKLNTYSDAALTIPNTNPVILDSAGRAGSIFLQNLKYKVILSPSTDTDPPTSPIWTMDPVYTSDVSTVAQVQGSNGNPNGQLAGTAGSATIPASMAWDYVNDILYICTTTGTASTAVWTAINPASSASVLPSPQGRLTLTTQTPVIAGDVSAATTVFYTPYVGLLVPIYNGTSFTPTSIVSELSMNLVAGHAANNIYDFYIFNLSGVATLGTGPSWSAGAGGSVTAGSCARGTGAGGAALSRLQGVLTNSVSMTALYGAALSTTVAPNQGTYVGSMYVDGTNGQVTCNISAGQSRKYGIWNAYNRVPISLQVFDGTSTWTYNSTFRPSNGNIANTFTSFAGLAEENVSATFVQRAQSTSSAAAVVGIGLNSSASPSGFSSILPLVVSLQSFSPAQFIQTPVLGISVMTSLEQSTGGSGTTFSGGSTNNMLLQGTYRG